MDRFTIKYADNADRVLWDRYVWTHPNASICHVFNWRDIIHKTYGHATYYLMAFEEQDHAPIRDVGLAEHSINNVVGVLPLVHLNHVIFGNHLISMPYLDGGGILASSVRAERRLLRESLTLGENVGASAIELRHEQPLRCRDDLDTQCSESSGRLLKATATSDKVRMLLPLLQSYEQLMKSLKSKVRSQIRKPLKEGLKCKVGGVDLVDDFYRVFVANMRDLGSPVHSVNLMRNVVKDFGDQTRVFVVYGGKEPVASSVVVGFKGLLGNPWASSLRKYTALSPNMLLYSCMLQFGCEHGYHVFDFGRSSPTEGTYKFKQQWGALPARLYWYYISLDANRMELGSLEKKRFERAIRYWKMLPLPVTRIIGPSIRKYIGL